MNGHDELISLLGAYALDAVDDDERRAIDDHLDGCATCRAEVAQHLEVAAALGTTAALSAPDDLWTTIQQHLDDGPLEVPAGPPVLGLAGLAVEATPAAPTTPAPRAAAPPAGDVVSLADRRRPTGFILGLVAAAAVIAFLVVGLVQANNQNKALEDKIAAGPPAASIDQLADQAMQNPSNQVVKLTSESGSDSATAVVTPTGQGYLVSSTLDPLPADQTYQLWNINDAGAVSLGVLGNDPGAAAFHVQGPVGTLAITAEQAGGVPTPANVPLVTATV